MILINKMDEFIKKYALIYYQNPNFPITSNTMYAELMNYELTKDEIENSSIKNQIEALENDFSSSKHLNVYVDSRQPKFLQFFHWSKTDNKCVKLYLNIPKEYVGYVAHKVFNYIDKNRMQSYSKVASRVRADGIVLRLASEEDAKKVIEFINKDKTIASVARNTNPFSLKEGVVGIGYDDSLSYNDVLSNCLSDYFKILREKNMLNKASILDFSRYLNNYYNDVFVNTSKLLDFTRTDMFVSSIKRFSSVGEVIANYEQVIRLVNGIISNNVNLKIFFKFYETCDNKNTQENQIKQYEQAYNYRTLEEQKANESLSNLNSDNKELVMLSSIVNDYIIYAFSKYKKIEEVIQRLNNYLIGDVSSITRDLEFRSYFMLKITPEKLKMITNNDINSYVSKIVDANIDQNDSMIDKYNLFYEACLETYNKYGYYHLKCALKEASMGIFDYITNGTANYRNKMKKTIKPEEITSLCAYYLQIRGYDLNNSIDIIATFTDDLVKYTRSQNDIYQAR